MLAHGRVDKPSIYSLSAPVRGVMFIDGDDGDDGDRAVDVLDAHVHTHQRFSHSVYVLAGHLADYPYIPPQPTPYASFRLPRPCLSRSRVCRGTFPRRGGLTS